jgi:SAM-dependent methyltransferase
MRPVARALGWHDYAPLAGAVNFGSLRRLTPISRHWGWDRVHNGIPVDRFYIERFLERHASDIRGHVLEAGDRSYTQRFGADKIVQSDILHPDPAVTDATITGDLNTGEGLPAEAFDCIVLTETLQLIFEARTAMQCLYRMLRPGGVLLLTAPGITHIGDSTWREHWYWMFTAQSLGRLAGEQFPAGSYEVHAYGNVLAATAFLYGLAASELTTAELEATDPDYPVALTLRAVKGCA